MITTKVGFITYGVHKDGLKDPLGAPFIDGQIVAQAKDALRGAHHRTRCHHTNRGPDPAQVADSGVPHSGALHHP